MNILKQLAQWYFTKKATPYWMVLLFDCTAVVMANLIVYVLYNGANATAQVFWPLVGTLLVYLIPYLIGFRIMRTYAGVMRYSSFADLYRVAIANAIGVVSVEALRIMGHTDQWLITIRWRELIFAWLIATGIMFAARILIKYLFDIVREDHAQRRVFIYGTKGGGMALAKMHWGDAKAILKAHRDFRRMRAGYTQHPTRNLLREMPECHCNIVIDHYLRGRKVF